MPTEYEELDLGVKHKISVIVYYRALKRMIKKKMDSSKRQES